MTERRPTGVSYPSREAGPIDDWSHQFYLNLQEWQPVADGEWTRWDPGYLVLTVDRVNGEEIDPIKISSEDGDITVEFGGWEAHSVAPFAPNGDNPIASADFAKSLVEEWLSGGIKTAVFTNSNGEWCGSAIIEEGDLSKELAAATQKLRLHNPAMISVRTPRQKEWSSHIVPREWLRPAPLSAKRLPK